MKGIFLPCAFVAALLWGSSAHAENCQLELRDGVFGEWQGRCKDGKAYGKGVAILDNATFEGEARDGRAHGRVQLKYADGTILEGEFVEGKADGQGIFVDGDGNRHVGEITGSPAQASFTMTSSEGERRIGVFEDGEPVKQTESAASVGSTVSGTVRDQAVGSTAANGAARAETVVPHCWLAFGGEFVDWQGECKNGRADGEGKATAADGSTYTGSAKDGRPDGFGTINGPQGYYQGDFKGGLRHGSGIIQGPDGEYYKANFQNGFQATEGVLVQAPSPGDETAAEVRKASAAPYPDKDGSGAGKKSQWDQDEADRTKQWAPDFGSTGSQSASGLAEDTGGKDDAYDRALARTLGKGDGVVRSALPDDDYTAKLTALEKREAERRATKLARESEEFALKIRKKIDDMGTQERQAAHKADKERRRAALETEARKGLADLNAAMQLEQDKRAREERQRKSKALLDRNVQMFSLQQTLNRNLAKCNNARSGLCWVGKNGEKRAECERKWKRGRALCMQRARSDYQSRMGALMLSNP